MLKATINEWPHSQKCMECPFTYGIVQETLTTPQMRKLGANSYICSRSEDAETCEIPTATAIAKRWMGNMTKIDSFRSLLTHRRRLAAKTDCKECGGSGETIDLESKILSACSCTKRKA